jgi:hypothetical protein
MDTCLSSFLFFPLFSSLIVSLSRKEVPSMTLEELLSTYALWSDDCLSCLCNLPHPLEEHLQAVERAHAELEEAHQLFLHEYSWLYEGDEEEVSDLDECS